MTDVQCGPEGGVDRASAAASCWNAACARISLGINPANVCSGRKLPPGGPTKSRSDRWVAFQHVHFQSRRRPSLPRSSVEKLHHICRHHSTTCLTTYGPVLCSSSLNPNTFRAIVPTVFSGNTHSLSGLCCTNIGQVELYW